MTAHVVTSVGWLGGAYTMLVLGLGGALSTDAAFRLACYEVMHLFDEAVNIPLALAMLVTGLLSSLGTRWGLVRHRWVLTKFLISSTVLVVTPLLSVPRVHTMIERLHANVDRARCPPRSSRCRRRRAHPHHRHRHLHPQTLGPHPLGTHR